MFQHRFWSKSENEKLYYQGIGSIFVQKCIIFWNVKDECLSVKCAVSNAVRLRSPLKFGIIDTVNFEASYVFCSAEYHTTRKSVKWQYISKGNYAKYRSFEGYTVVQLSKAWTIGVQNVNWWIISGQSALHINSTTWENEYKGQNFCCDDCLEGLRRRLCHDPVMLTARWNLFMETSLRCAQSQNDVHISCSEFDMFSLAWLKYQSYIIRLKFKPSVAVHQPEVDVTLISIKHFYYSCKGAGDAPKIWDDARKTNSILPLSMLSNVLTRLVTCYFNSSEISSKMVLWTLLQASDPPLPQPSFQYCLLLVFSCHWCNEW